ncbi:VOC family protein [Streptomyces albidoflavus]|uniref:VOC family protein n=1 Tax=Streptomyces albidoflavus TaxID=1886 RepID=UPI0033E0CD64
MSFDWAGLEQSVQDQLTGFVRRMRTERPDDRLYAAAVHESHAETGSVIARPLVGVAVRRAVASVAGDRCTPGEPRWSPADRPRPHEEAVRAYWAAATGSTVSLTRGERGEFVTFLPCGGADPSFKYQTVTDGPGGAHVDLCVEDVPACVRHAQDAGATTVFEEPGLSVLRSPAGLDCCVVPWAGSGHRRPWSRTSAWTRSAPTTGGEAEAGGACGRPGC